MQLKPLKNKALLGVASLKLGIVLMVAVVVASIVGTIFPYEKSLDLVFYSWWFRVLLLALAVNLAFCTYQTLATKVFPLLKPRFPKSAEYYEEEPLRFGCDSTQSPEAVAGILRRNGFRVSQQGDYLCARKGLIRLFAAPLVHLGFVLVLASGFASGLFALDGRIRLVEGDSTTMMYLPSSEPGAEPTTRSLGFEVRCLEFDTANFPQTQIPSRFISTVQVTDGDKRFVDTVEVNKSLRHRGLKFHQTSYGTVPDRMRHYLQVVDSTESRTAEVAIASGGTMPVADWGMDLSLQQTVAGLRYAMGENGKTVASGFVGAKQSEMGIKAVRFVPDFIIGPDRRIESRSDEMNNPALQVSWMNGETATSQQWLFQRPELRGFSHRPQDMVKLELESSRKLPDDGGYEFKVVAKDNASNKPLAEFTMKLGDTVNLADFAKFSDVQSERFKISLLKTGPLQYTDLSISANPMIPVIYFGSILACAAIFLALYVRRVTVWVWCDQANGRLRTAIRYSPERSVLSPGLERVLAALKDGEKTDA